MIKKNILVSGPLVLILILMMSPSCRKPPYPDGLYAELHTTKGMIVLALEYEKTPMSTANFVGLAEGTIQNTVFPQGTPFYNGSRFHRVVPGHVIQAGAPNIEGRSDTGYQIPNEIHPDLSHDRAGMLGMANGGPHTNSSQFYITLGDRSYLDGDYTVFGRVQRGMEVVNGIEQGDEIMDVKIVRIGKAAKRFKSDNDTFQNLVEQVKTRVEEAEKKKAAEEAQYIRQTWPEAVTTESGLRYIVRQTGQGQPPKKGDRFELIYTGSKLAGEKFFSTEEEGRPGNVEPALPFIFETGKSSINPGFDEAISAMLPGEKRLLIVPAELAYGRRGFYGPNVPGQKRFVISPYATLIYEVERLKTDR